MAGTVAPDRGRLTTSTPNRLPRLLLPALGIGPVLFVGSFYVLPIVRLLGRAVHVGDISSVLQAPGLGRVMWFTLWQAVVSTVVTVIVGFVPAYVLARHRFRGRRLMIALITVPFMLPTVVVGAAFLAVLPDRWHNTAIAVLAADRKSTRLNSSHT